jgi:hypothetical protein
VRITILRALRVGFPFTLAVLLMAQAAGTESPHLNAADTGTPDPPVRIGRSEKVCQLTGEIDWETGLPTAAKTFTSAGLDAADLGYPVEHGDKLILLFGDSWPPPHGGGAAGELPPDDAVGVTTRKDPPTEKDGRCLELEVHHRSRPTKAFLPATILGPTRVKQGFFNVPSGGVTAAGHLFAFFWTDHCSDPTPLRPLTGNPLARPPRVPGRDCPEVDGRNSIGRGVLARSDDEANTFSHVVSMPTGFVYSTAINSNLQPDLPQDQRLGIFIFSAPRYRASVPYLAYAAVESLADPATWRFFTGRTAEGKPIWVTYDEWQRSPAGNVPQPAGWRPPGGAELFTPNSDMERCVGEFSVTWNAPLHMWLMLYNCDFGGIKARVAPAPWGPWSAPTHMFVPEDKLGCHLVMTAEGCGNRRNYWPRRKDRKFVGGGLYAPFVLNRFTTQASGDGPGRRATIYWVVSSWNPYQVSVIRATLQSDFAGPLEH